jgi:hypothetical protein
MKKATFFLAAVFCMFVASGATYAQAEDDVVINEFSVNPTTGKEYVELLVTKPGGVNMQGWTVSDVGTRAGATAATEGDVTLPAASYLANVPQGTYIVIVFTTPAANSNTLTEDTSLADGNGKLVLIVGTTVGLITGGTIDNATADNVHLYAGTRAAGTLIDQVLVGTNVSFIAGATWGDNNSATLPDNVNAGVAMPGNSIARFVPTTNTLAGFQDNDTGARFVVDAASYGTPGSTNTGVTDSAVTNPSYSTGNVDAGSFNGLTITGNVGLAGGVTVHGTMAITTGVVTTGASTLTIDCGGSISGASPTTYVNGNLKKNYCATGVKGFEVGTANGYSPVSVTITAATFPTDFTVKAVQGPQPNVNAYGRALQRYWTLTATGVTADLNFNYLDIDVPATATESSFVIFKYNGSFSMPGGTVSPGSNQASISGVTSFSDWTLAEPAAPTAADGSIGGITVDGNGVPISGAVIYLSGTQNRKTITDANGNYRFDNVETSGFYTVTPSRVNYNFNPFNRSFSQLGNRTDAVFTATRASGFVNPLDTPEYFVRQHYLDFLGREPDESGFNFWSDQILECAGDAACVERRTVNVSAAYFLSVEFQQTGGLVDRLYKASFGRSPRYAEFMPDTAAIARGVVVGRTGWEGQLAANKETFVAGWLDRAAFHAAFDDLSNDAYVATLLSNTGASFAPGDRDSLVSGLNAGTLSRGQALQQIANNENFARGRFNEAFVMMEYFGYLRRDPDAGGFAFWLNKLSEFNGNFERAEMVKAFIDSGEYRARFAR